jgi:hypothetical protein
MHTSSELLNYDGTINVIDSIMGSGKTTWMINHINRTYQSNMVDQLGGLPGDRRFLYVAPLLSEVDRIMDACPELRFKDPQPVEGRKFYHLKSLIETGENVCTTHALFRLLDGEVYRLLKAQNYTLVIDEVITCVDMLTTLSRSDRNTLFDNGFVYVEEATGKLWWNHGRYPSYRGRFDDIRSLCDNGNLVVYRPRRWSTHGRKEEPVVLLWEFPSDFLKCFNSVFILTYLFHGSPMMAYLRAEGLRFVMKAAKDGKLMPWQEVDEGAMKSRLRSKVKIYEGPMNEIGTRRGKGHPLSSSWFDRADVNAIKKLKNSTTRFFEKVSRTPSAANAWTTFSKVRKVLTGKGYARGFIPVNAKATNDYIEKRSLAYLCNIFHQPIIKCFFEEQGIRVYDDLHALSEMVQWLWRSQIRRGDPVTVYVPSQRMRELLKMWIATNGTANLLEAVEHRLDPTHVTPLMAAE